ncbi:MAG: hypothetical protein WBB97_03810, partial [Dehalococcoidales bacterium]
MSLTCGMVGLTACGKTTIYNAVTAAGAASFDGSEMHNAIVSVPDERLQAHISQLNPTDRQEFLAELGLKESS